MATAYPPLNPDTIYTTDDIERLHEARRLPATSFFSATNMKAFRTKVLSGIFKGPGGVYFVISNQFKSPDSRTAEPRFYRVCKFYLDSTGINQVGAECDTPGQARKLAQKLADTQEEPYSEE